MIRGGKRSASGFFLGGSLVRRKRRMERCVLIEIIVITLMEIMMKVMM